MLRHRPERAACRRAGQGNGPRRSIRATLPCPACCSWRPFLPGARTWCGPSTRRPPGPPRASWPPSRPGMCLSTNTGSRCATSRSCAGQGRPSPAATSCGSWATRWPWWWPRRKRRRSRALGMIRIEWEDLPLVLDPEAAMQPGACQLHPDAPGNITYQYRIRKGDAAAALGAGGRCRGGRRL